jgi:pSer/pThr/pTyr-binding forkhead associated (FHA) protein
VTDLGSTNGTFVEDRPVNSRGLRIRVGDRLTVGNVTLQLAEG